MVSLRMEIPERDSWPSECCHKIFSLHGRWQKLSKGDVLFNEGDASSAVYFLHDGMLGLRKTDRNGRSVLVRLMYPGAFVGQVGCEGRDAHLVGAEALAVSNVYSVPTATFRGELNRSPGLREWFLGEVAAELYEAETRIVQLAGYTAKARLALFLLELSDGGAPAVRLPLRRHELADYLGIRAETLARVTRRLEETGIASFKGQEAVIHDRQALEALSAAAE